MSEVFLKIVNMSISAGWLILAVLALRLLLKKAPKWVNVLLWGIVAVRLICPFSIESALSLIPSTETISPEIMLDWTPEISTGIEPLNKVVNPIITASFAPEPLSSANPLQILIPVWANIWLLGMLAMLLYSAVSYLSLRKKVSTAVILRDNIFQSETVSAPFVLGILKPRIYLPFQLDGQNLEHVVAHERAHIRRKDHWWKPLGFLLLTIHWFNPLMWIAYILLCRDIELACDEKVIKELGNEQRADYTQALVACSVNRRMIAACPLAFGEVGVKERVISIMNYRKPAFWIIILSVIACVGVALCFLTNPATSVDERLAVFIDCEIASHNQTEYSKDNFCCLDWEVIGKETSGDLTTVYMWALYKEYSNDDGLTVETASHLLTAITVKEDSGSYSLVEYWIPEDGSYYSDSIKEKVPMYLWGKAMDSQRYIDKQSKKLEKLAKEHFGITNTTAAAVTKWFDYTGNHSQMSYENELKIQLDEFPDITFKYTPYEIIATTSWDDSELEGHTILVSGMPIWNAYFADLTGDGMPELCSSLSMGSGMIDNRVIIFDYANGVSYKLEDRGYHDYYLRMDNADGYLHVDKRIYNSDELVSSGRLVYKDGCIQIEGVNSKPVAILRAKILENHDGYFLVEPVAGSWELSSADRIEVPMQNMSPSPEPQLGDIIEIRYNGEIMETYPAKIGEVYSIRVIGEDDGKVTMVPTSANMSGLFDSYLYLTIDGATYRYERQTTDTESVEAGELIDTLYENTGFETYSYDVYSVAGCDDLSMVLAVNTQHGGGVYRYSPSKRCDDSALQEAKAAGYVVMEDGDVTSGQESWRNFYETTWQGKRASITVAHYHTLDPDGCTAQYYEAYKEDYPCLFLLDLTYDGEKYTLSWNEYGTQYVRTYEYLMRYVTNNYSVTSSALPENTLRYVLTHDNKVTWEDLINGLYSSQSGAYIDHYAIYTDRE